MGFGHHRAIRALHFTQAKSVDAAMEWLLAHSEDADIDTPLVVPAAPLAAAAAVSGRRAAAAGDESSEDSDDSDDGVEAYKLVLLVRTDLHMRVGKIAAQCAHAAVGLVLELQTGGDQAAHALHAWMEGGQAKVTLAIKDADEMHALERAAQAKGLHTHIVADAGRTQVEPGSETVLSIGPGPLSIVDSVTGHLKLL
jgi:PTH2 family peptidyl-tRNA hydrolase